MNEGGEPLKLLFSNSIIRKQSFKHSMKFHNDGLCGLLTIFCVTETRSGEIFPIRNFFTNVIFPDFLIDLNQFILINGFHFRNPFHY